MSPATQLAGFIAKFAPDMAARIRSLRAAMRRRLPHAHEMVYDNYNFFVIGYGPTERPSEAVFSLACQASGVSLCFLHGARLPDPAKLLRGSGNQVRSLKLPDAALLEEPAVAALIDTAIERAPVPFDSSLRPRLIIKSVSAKQRPRRAVAKSGKSPAQPLPAPAAAQLAGFLARFSPKVCALTRTVQTQMRRSLPHAHELVYNYDHACVISYGPTERPYEAPLSLSVQASGVSLYFLDGPNLPDPKKLLRGSGKQVRFVTLPNAAVLKSPAVEALIAAALKSAPVRFDHTAEPRLIIKSNSAKPPSRPARAPVGSVHSKFENRKSKI